MHSLFRSLLNDSYLLPSDKKTSVFLHTSCVLDDSLKYIFSSSLIRSKYNFYVTDDCYHELTLLKNRSEIRKFSSNAEIILRFSLRAKDINIRELYGFYHPYNSVLARKLKPSAENPYVFIFCNGAAAEEFICNTVPDRRSKNYSYFSGKELSALNNVKILYFNIKENGSQEVSLMYTAPVRLSTFNRETIDRWHLRMRPCRIDLFSDDDYLDENGNIANISNNILIRDIEMKTLKSVDAHRLKVYSWGGMAYIYNVDGIPELSDSVVKIFKKKHRDPEIEKYIRYIAGYKYIFKNRISLPEAIVYDSKGEFIGFTMKRLPDAEKLENVDSTDFEQSRESAADLSLLMLEMRLFQLEMNDISGTNFSKTADNRIIMYDPDSVECRKYIFNKYFITKRYSHKDMLYKRCSNKNNENEYFRPIHYNDFSYSVLLFQTFILYNPLDNNYTEESDNYSDWIEAFEKGLISISENSSKFSVNSNDVWLNKMSLAQRKAFIAHFSFKRVFTIGQWLGLMNIT